MALKFVQELRKKINFKRILFPSLTFSSFIYLIISLFLINLKVTFKVMDGSYWRQKDAGITEF